MEKRLSDLLLFVVKEMVERPDEVSVTAEEREDDIVFQLRVSKDDMGRVIGRGGRTAKDLRTIMRSAAHDSPKKIMVDIVD